MKTDSNFNRLGVMLDCSRNAVMNIPTLKRYIDLLADLGFNTLMLYTEDTYEVKNQPYFGYLRGRYTAAELKEIDDYAAGYGIELIPAIQTLAHLNAIFRWKPYREINDYDDILLCKSDKTYELIDNMFETLSRTLRTKTINIGLDEAHMLGRGKYQDLHGFEDRFDILLNHVNKISEIAEKYGLKCLMWGDMFFRLLGDGYGTSSDVVIPDRIKEMIPHNVDLIYWDYYSTDYNNYVKRIKHHQSLKDGIWFAGGLWSWTGFAPHNGYSIDATKAAFKACEENGVKDVVLTMWGDNGAECSKFTLLPSLYYASEAAKGNYNMDSIKEGFFQKFGIPFDDYMELDLIGTPNCIKDRICNPDKYMLYSDGLMGFLDCTVREGDAKSYAEAAEKLKEPEQNPEYGYLFKTMRTLCDILSLKIDIGLRTRSAYYSKDKAALALIADEYDQIASKLERFYEAFRSQWFKENKPHGFEIQDARIGGLYFRIKHCRERINKYISGEINIIEELEEKILDAYPNEPVQYNYYSKNISANIF